MLKPLHLVKGAAIFLTLGITAVAQQPAGPPAFPGFFRLPKPGEVLSSTVQDQLKLSGDQKKQLAEVQKDVDTRLGKILTDDQNKSLQKMRDRKGPAPRPFGGGGGFPGMFPGGFGTVGLNDVKKAIQATDEEWKVIGPKLQKVIAARRVFTTESRTADTGPAARPGDAPARPAPRSGENNVITQAHAEFKTVLDDPKHTKEQLTEAADAVRKARDKARTGLRATQDDLRQLLTKEQETILLGLGYLD